MLEFWVPVKFFKMNVGIKKKKKDQKKGKKQLFKNGMKYPVFKLFTQ